MLCMEGHFGHKNGEWECFAQRSEGTQGRS